MSDCVAILLLLASRAECVVVCYAASDTVHVVDEKRYFSSLRRRQFLVVLLLEKFRLYVHVPYCWKNCKTCHTVMVPANTVFAWTLRELISSCLSWKELYRVAVVERWVSFPTIYICSVWTLRQICRVRKSLFLNIGCVSQSTRRDLFLQFNDKVCFGVYNRNWRYGCMGALLAEHISFCVTASIKKRLNLTELIRLV